MRRAFSNILEKIAVADEDVIFITGDLGYNALENLSAAMGSRFINAGVAEQNMIGVAAGLAHKGFKVFCYSIAPFIVYRCLEQFRNDVCLHNLPVFIVGNGGGYGYGIMGSSHHALEDIAVLSGLQNVTCYVPAFTEDVEIAVNTLLEKKKPAYLRLGSDVKLPEYQSASGNFNHCVRSIDPEITIAVMGPVVKNVLEAVNSISFNSRADVFTAFTFPVTELSSALVTSVKKTKRLLVVEEHIPTGGLAQQIGTALLANGITTNKFQSLHAAGYPGGLYGDAAYHQQQSGLSPSQIAETIRKMCAVT
jgi:transketolase